MGRVVSVNPVLTVDYPETGRYYRDFQEPNINFLSGRRESRGGLPCEFHVVGQVEDDTVFETIANINVVLEGL